LRGRRSLPQGVCQVCTTVRAKTAGALAEKASRALTAGSDLVELRLDLLDRPTTRVQEELAHLAGRSIFTVRTRQEGGGFRGSESERLALIEGLLDSGPLYVDVELAAIRRNPGWFRGLPGKTRKIVSWHSLDGTPASPVLRRARRLADSYGGITKMVALAQRPEDGLRVLALYGEAPQKLVAFCMGEAGTASRIMGMLLGSPIVYASLPGEVVAPGQLPLSTVCGLKTLLEKGRW
jgi:3-dehydroquinate dehydratase-1